MNSTAHDIDDRLYSESAQVPQSLRRQSDEIRETGQCPVDQLIRRLNNRQQHTADNL